MPVVKTWTHPTNSVGAILLDLDAQLKQLNIANEWSPAIILTTLTISEELVARELAVLASPHVQLHPYVVTLETIQFGTAEEVTALQNAWQNTLKLQNVNDGLPAEVGHHIMSFKYPGGRVRISTDDGGGKRERLTITG